MVNIYGNVCYDHSITFELEKYDDELYVSFVFCCYLGYKIIRYPFEDVCKNFDEYLLKCLKILNKTKICTKCNKYQGFDIKDIKSYTISNGVNFTCSQRCKYCCVRKIKRVENYDKYNKQLMVSVLNSKLIHCFCPSVCGEPFEDSYIRNEFMFNLHKSNIKELTILTNLIHIDKEYLTNLKTYFDKYGIKYYFVINVSGFDKNTYESYCSSKFETLVENVKMFNAIFGNESCRIVYIVSNHNRHIPEKTVIEDFKNIFPFFNPTYNLGISIDEASNCIDTNLKNEYFDNVEDEIVDNNLKHYIK